MAAALDGGKDDFTRVALALKAGLTLQSVHYILAAKNAEVITALVWKAGMSMRFAMDVQKSSPGCRSAMCSTRVAGWTIRSAPTR